MPLAFQWVCSHAVKWKDIHGQSAYKVEASAQNISGVCVLNACKGIAMMWVLDATDELDVLG